MPGDWSACRKRSIPRALASCVGLAGLLMLVGCRSADSKREAWMSMKPPLLAREDTSHEPYRVGLGDVLLIAPEDGGQPIKAEVSLDGTLRFPDIEPMEVDGLTCEEVEGLFAPYVDVHVEIAEYRSQYVLISGLGEDETPRPVAYHGPETVEQVLQRVGCPDCQQGFRVRVVRPSDAVGGDPQIFADEIDERGRRQGNERPVILEAGDYVYVEKDIGRKGPLTLMTDKDFYTRSFGYLKRLRLAEANEELDVKQK